MDFPHNHSKQVMKIIQKLFFIEFDKIKDVVVKQLL